MSDSESKKSTPSSSAISSPVARRQPPDVAIEASAASTMSNSVLGQETPSSTRTVAFPASVGEQLAQYAMTLRFEDLPADVVRMAKRSILDTLGCAFGGFAGEASKIAKKLASNASAQQPATVLFSGTKTTPDLAVFTNGVMIRYLDFNDAYVSQTMGAGHPSDMIAALLTAAELKQLGGRDLITATVLAYEVFCKFGDVLDYDGNGIDHSTIIGLGAVVGAGRLMGLTAAQMVHAIGITVGGNTATRQGRADKLSNWKSYAAADACRKAFFAVQLAQAGMTGPSDVFEGRYGFFKVIGRPPVGPVQLGEPFGMRRTFTKRFPLGQFSQTVAQAAMEARTFFERAGDIQDIAIHVSRPAIKAMADGPDKWRPQTRETADHSIPYAAGLVLLHGKIEPEFYEHPYLQDGELLDLVGRIKVVPSDEADRPGLSNLCELEVVLKSGAHRTFRVENHRGHFKNPMTDAEMEEKFRLLAQKHLSRDRVDVLLGRLWNIESEPQVGTLLAATCS